MKEMDENICLIDSATTHTILKSERYFSCIKMGDTIVGSAKLIQSSGRTIVFLGKGTKSIIENALYSPKSRRNLLSFKYIRRNDYHIETLTETNNGYLLITKTVLGTKQILEKLPSLSSDLYYTRIHVV